MGGATPDVVTLSVPDDPRFLGLAIAAVEALAARAGVDKDEVTELRYHLEEQFALRFAGSGGRVTLRYEVGDGFLGLRLLDGTGSTRGRTS